MKQKEKKEQRLIEHFLQFYDGITGKQYQVDRRPDINNRTTPQPDFICRDLAGEEIAVEITTLRGPLDWKWHASAAKFLGDVSSRLEGKLCGTFLLRPVVRKINFTQEGRKTMIDQLCQEILRVAPSLGEGEEATLRQPCNCRIRKWKIQGSKLEPIPHSEGFWGNAKETRQQFKQALGEANKKFTNYINLLTILLLGIWKTGIDYDEFVKLLPTIDMNNYKNVKYIYLYDTSPASSFHLWPHSTSLHREVPN